MSWPSPQDYNEAIQTPHLSFDDPELRAGVPETNRLGLPRAITGAFASVYRIHCHDRDWAVRCFLRDIPDQSARYLQISKYVMSDDLSYTVGFDYLPRGIKVQGQWYPILKMEWLEGESLDQYLRRRVDEPKAIAAVLKSFEAMTYALREAGIAHGDLQHGNILVVDGDLRLVDYDCMYVPGLSGFQANELGHRNYQHPARSSKDFAPGLDNFSIRVIETSLLSLSLDPSLWEKVSAGDECLLFRDADYRQPLLSRVFYLLEKHEIEQIRDSAAQLRHSLPFAPMQVPFLDVTVEAATHLPDLDSLSELGGLESGDLAARFQLFAGRTNGAAAEGSSPVLFAPLPLPDSVPPRGIAGLTEASPASSALADNKPVSPVDVYCSQGNQQNEFGNFEQAVRYFQKALYLDPDSPAAFCGIGIAHSGLKEFSLSYNNFSAALRLSPGFAQAYAGRGLALNGLGQFARAIADFNRALEIDPGNARALSGRGIAQCQLKQYGGALKDLEAAILANPNNAEIYCSHGVVVQSMGRHEQSIRDFDMALSLNANLAPALYYRGRSHFELGRASNAIADFDAAIQLRPAYYECYFARGAVLNSLSRHREAIATLEKGLSYAEDKPEAGWWGLGMAYYGLKEYARAGSLFELSTRRGAVLPREADEAKVLSARGFSCIDLADYARALEYFDKAIGINSVLKEAYLGRGITLLKQGSPGEALSDLNEYLKHERGAEALSWRALSALRLGKLNAAASDLQESLSLDSSCALAYLGRGSLRLELMQWADALKDFEQSLCLGLKGSEALYGRMLASAFCKLEAGESKKALAEFKQLSGRDQAMAFCGQALAHLSMRKYKEAGKEFEQALSLQPGCLAALLGQARLFMEGKQYDRALEAANTAVSLNPSLPETYRQRALVWSKMGLLDMAEEDRQRAQQAEEFAAR